jgi:hypothetical protein
MQRIVGNLRYQLACKQGEPLINYRSMEIQDLVREWLDVMEEITSKGHKVKVILDGLDKIDHGLKVSKVLCHSNLAVGIQLTCMLLTVDQFKNELVVSNNEI